jgi:hypothetical protein
MRKYGPALGVAILALLLLGAQCNPDPEYIDTLSVQLRAQEQSNWCWAASGQMTMEFLGHNVSQCTQANNRFNRTDCCTNGSSTNCNRGGWPEYGEYDFTASVTNNTALNWNQIKYQIHDRESPVAFSWHWIDNMGNYDGGHMMVLHGYIRLDDEYFVLISDPWAPNVGERRTITYAEYVSRAGHHAHWNDYYDITYVGP